MAIKLFRTITIPSIRPALIVVLTTIAIGTLKAFDIVYTTTGGNFKTSVIANEFYKQSFVPGTARSGRRLRRAAVHPGDPDRRLQRPAPARGGVPMTAVTESVPASPVSRSPSVPSGSSVD